MIAPRTEPHRLAEVKYVQKKRSGPNNEAYKIRRREITKAYRARKKERALINVQDHTSDHHPSPSLPSAGPSLSPALALDTVGPSGGSLGSVAGFDVNEEELKSLEP